MQVPLYYPYNPRLDRRLVKLYVQQVPSVLTHLSYVPQEGEGSVGEVGVVREVVAVREVGVVRGEQPHK